MTKQEQSLANRIGANVAHYRKAAEITQEKLAKEAKVTIAHVSSIENGRRLPRLTLLVRIASTLGTPIDVLVNRKD